MSSSENRRLRPASILTLAMVTLSCSGIAFASESSDGCRCMLTFSTGAAHEAYCDGFDAATHERCACEKQTTANGAVACVPKTTRSADSVAADRYERARRGR